MPITAPVLLSADHDTSQFRCQLESSTLWFQKHALANNVRRGSRTHVVCDGMRVIGFYALAAGSVQHDHAPKAVTRNMPKPNPAIVLARLAVDADHQGQGIGAGLLQDAIFRTFNAANDIAARVLLCHAIDDAARAFYIRHGFLQSPVEDLTVMLDLAKVAALIR